MYVTPHNETRKRSNNKKPNLRIGNKINDYGQGFYCAESLEMAKECPEKIK